MTTQEQTTHPQQKVKKAAKVKKVLKAAKVKKVLKAAKVKKAAKKVPILLPPSQHQQLPPRTLASS